MTVHSRILRLYCRIRILINIRVLERTGVDMKYFLVAILTVLAVCANAEWKTDFLHQYVDKRPAIEVRYTDGSRNGFEIDSECYKIKANLQSGSGQALSFLAIGRKNKSNNVLAGTGAYLRVKDSSGREYTSINTLSASRINIYRRGPYYIETHWLDITLTGTDNTSKAPIKGEIIFYSYPEKTHVGIKLHVTGEIKIAQAELVMPFKYEIDSTGLSASKVPYCDVASDKPEQSFRLMCPVENGVSELLADKNTLHSYIYNSDVAEVWKEGEIKTAYLEILPLDQHADGIRIESEMDAAGSVSVEAIGCSNVRYDSIRGCYAFQTDTKGGFTYHFNNPNDYETAPVVMSSKSGGKVYVMHETGINSGFVECGVVLENSGHMLPLTVQISKNFCGENEEPFYNPGDPSFSETIFPVHLQAGEQRKFTSLHLYQNWGNHELKQFSSLGAWMDYYHMSTGVTETTCYVPFLFGGPAGVNIADLRPMSQRMWDSQPQHDNVAGHSFLRYKDSGNVWHYLEYVGTTFRSTGPNWADMSLNYISDDGKVKLRADVFEVPQLDELRNFMHIRMDFDEGLEIADGDLARNLRIFNIATNVQALKYTTVACGGAAGKPAVAEIKFDNSFTIAGMPIDARGGFAAVYPEIRGANAYIIRNFKGMIGGKSIRPAASLYEEKNGNCTLMLTAVGKAGKTIKKDYIELDMFIMPYGGGGQDYLPAQKAAADFAVNAPKVTSIKRGKLISNFPTKIRLDSQGKAEFSVSGGTDRIPIIVEGAKNYTSLRIYDSEGRRIEHSQPGDKDGYQVFVDRNGTFGYVFLVNADGKEHRYVVK